MRLRFLHFTLLLAGLSLSGCATPAYEPLPAAARGEIASTDVVLPIKQGEIYVFVPDSGIAAAGGGGLLLALVDVGVNSVRTSKAEAAVQPLRDATVDFNFDDTLQSDLRADFAGTPWLHTGSFRVMKDASIAGLDSAIDMSRASAVLLATTDYHLSNDADVLTVTMSAALYPKADALLALKPAKGSPKSSPANALYRNILTFETTQPRGQSNRDQNIATLSANNGAVIRAELRFAADKLARMLAVDLAGADLRAVGDDKGVVNRAADGTLKFTAVPVL